MPVATARKVIDLSQSKDPAKDLAAAVGDLSGHELFFNQILVATYIRPEKTAGGIYRPQNNVEEDIYQGKVGLVLKKGPSAFNNDEIDYQGQNVEPGEWIVFRVGDGWSCTINGVACRVVADTSIRMKIKNPEGVF